MGVAKPTGLSKTEWLQRRDNQLAAVALVAALGLVVLVRTWVPFDEVFRGGAVVLAGNDPYFYRYWVEQLLASGLNPFHPIHLAQLPDGVGEHDVMFIWVMWMFAELLGGDARAAGLVLAWYPVVSAVVTAGLLYVLTWRLTEDRRVAILAVVVLALTPAHAYRTMLGFGDHHAFDYVALMLTATALVWLVTMDVWQPWKHVEWWAVVGLLGGAMAAQTLAWRGGPILLIPLAAYAVVASVSSVRAGRSPTLENLGLVVALVIAAGLAAFIHRYPNWAPAYRGYAPLLLLGLVVGLVAVSELGYRAGWPWFETGLLTPVVIAAWAAGLQLLAPSFLDPLRVFREMVEETTLFQFTDIGETASLLSSIETPLLLFGLLLVAAVPAMGWGIRKLANHYRLAWLAVLAYAWVFLALSVNRIRFTGQLAFFAAVFAALAVVWLAARMGYGEPAAVFDSRARSFSTFEPATLERRVRTAGSVLLVVVLLAGIGVAQLPATMDQITVDDEQYEAARWMAGHADAQGWEYPRTYVFSNWGTNRLYNYEVSGESQSYGYARRNYRSFVSSVDAAGWYEALEGATGFVVVRPSRFAYPPDSMQVRLVERYGSAGDGVSGLANYRLGYVGDDGSVLVFAVVPGATIVGNASTNSTVEVSTEVSVDGTSFTYRRTVETDGDGRFEVTVPYPGRYSVGDGEVVVDEAAVMSGETVRT